jgi:uncharacterized protein (TIGR03000 family)
MIRSQRVRPWVAALLLAGGFLAAPRAALAAPGGGHGGGAGHGAVGVRPGGFHHAVGPAYRGYYGYPRGYGAFGFGFGLGYGFGYGYGWGYPYAWGSPYGWGSSYPAYPYPYPSYVYPWDAAVYAAAEPGPAATPRPAAASEVSFLVRAPAGAALWVNGERSGKGGPDHDIVSAGLQPGRTYTYDFRVEYVTPDGRQVERSRTVSARAGVRYVIDLSAPAEVRPASHP